MLRRPSRCDGLYVVSSKDDPYRLQAELLKIDSASFAIIGLGRACSAGVRRPPPRHAKADLFVHFYDNPMFSHLKAG